MFKSIKNYIYYNKHIQTTGPQKAPELMATQCFILGGLHEYRMLAGKKSQANVADAVGEPVQSL
jgi:hypothetical protein